MYGSAEAITLKSESFVEWYQSNGEWLLIQTLLSRKIKERKERKTCELVCNHIPSTSG
jgi:hypothetical protein